MMIRTLLLFLIAGNFVLRASDPIPASYSGASATVAQPHVTAELIPESTLVTAGKPFDIILHLHMDAGWHTYWINPGDAGLATSIKWTLPDGFTAGPIQWPTPEKHNMGPLVTYGYDGDVYLLTTITPPKSEQSQNIKITARASWLVCQEECIPGKADLSLNLFYWNDWEGRVALNFNSNDKPADNSDLFNAARARLPVSNTRWEVKASYATTSLNGGKVSVEQIWIGLTNKPNSPDKAKAPGHLRFFPEQGNVLSTQEDKSDTGFFPGGIFSVTLQQNGERPSELSGVFVSDQPLIGNAKAVYLSEFPVAAEVSAAGPATATGETAPPSGTGTPAAAATPEVPAAQPWLLAVLGAAFVGGLILNLMPCVLPVLSLKVFSLMRHAGDDPRGAWKQGAAFTAGVVISFWALAGLLLALRAAGNQLGWGFQMQSPGFVLGLIFLFFLLGLNLFGVFELGASLVGLDAKATSHASGLTSSFLNGALATLAATPCTAPFMGSALGFAAQQPAFISMLIFTFLAFGMATPYLLLTMFPGALRFVPKPGAWMEAFKQFMGFLLMATVIFLLSVFGALVGEGRVFWLLGALLLAGIAAWIYGRWISFDKPLNQRWLPFLFMLVFLGAALKLGIYLAMAPVERAARNGVADGEGYQPWSQPAVDTALAQGQPVFVDFTAAWCLSCKVNERVALETEAVRKAFADKNVALFKADWTHSDPDISNALRHYNRDGVPLYLLYSPKQKDAPQVLPAVLTPGIVLDALNRL